VFLGEFVTGRSGGLETPYGLTFGPDGNLYVASASLGTGSLRAVLRFHGPSSQTPGAFMDVFVPPGSGGLHSPFGILFGPDGNHDGKLDLYVVNSEVEGSSLNGKEATIKRYDGVTGAFIDTFVTARSGGLDDAGFLTFTETDPVTLAYISDRLTATVSSPAVEILTADQVQLPLTEAHARWQAAGVDKAIQSGIDIRIADLPDAVLGGAVGGTLWLGSNATGWRWFVDATPRDDAEFNRPGDQVEQGYMDLLTAMTHELGHILGFEHEHDGVMPKTLAY
jgi:hypothetical protein